MFKFNFDVNGLTEEEGCGLARDDDLIESTDQLNINGLEKEPSVDVDGQIVSRDCQEISIDELIDYVPPFISYSTLRISTKHSIWKRDLYDAKFQSYLKDEEGALSESEQMFDPISSTSDLIPGIYEGGLKTWECSLDLAEVLVDGSFGKIKGHLLQSSNDQKDCYPKTLRIFELGCGTGVPSILLLFKIFYELLSQDPKKPQQSTEPILQIVLQDFNRDVLKLLTFPNILLSYIYAKLLLTNDQKGNSNHDEPLDPTADLEISDDLKQEFKTFLRDNRIDIRLIYGPWKALYKSLPPTLSADPSSQKKTVEDCNGSHDDDSDKQDEDEMVSQNGGTFDLIYSSETIYCLDSLDDLIELLIRCSKKPTQRGLLDDSRNLLVSSKVHYFGVGGGTNVFVRKIEKRNGTVKVVRSFNVESNDERSNPLSGIARIVMSIKF